MNSFLQRTILLLFFVILQRSFSDILWSDLEAPSLMIAATVALVFLLGFQQALGWVLLMIFLFMLLGTTSFFALFAIGVAYGTSFLSRRLLIEHRFQSILVLSAISAAAAASYLLLDALWHPSGIAFGKVAGNMLEAFLLFPLVFSLLRFSEEHIRTSLMSEFRGLRT